MYKRVLLKLSGEQLAGKVEHGFDASFAAWLAHEIKRVTDAGTQVVIMVGGGNYARGAQLMGNGIQRATADHIGMLATMMNALALTDVFEAQQLPTRCLSNIFAEQVAEPYVFRLAEKHLQKGRVVIVAGGIGRPFFTTDTAAVNLALELGCGAVLKATKVDGVYDKDPVKFPEAHKIEHMTFQQAVTDDNIQVMDKAAMGLAMDHMLHIVVFNAAVEGNILLAAHGDGAVGTTIS